MRAKRNDALQTPISGLPEMRHSNMRKSGKPRLAWIVTHTTFAMVPDQRCTASLSLALHRIRDTNSAYLSAYGVKPAGTPENG